MQQWTAGQVEAWLTNEMGLPAVAAAAGGDVDGGTAIELRIDEWKELGATGIKAAKIVSEIKKLQGRV